ncbi:hypothetical protein Pfo_014989 [Paulownia fortunei]|nr:hypothetical protein Pfo_014989 [Paulownia fortunei]
MKNKNKSISPPKNQQTSDENPENSQRAVIPIGPRFQADLPMFTRKVDKKSDTSQWLGTKVWPVESTSLKKSKQLKGNMDAIGRGRADVCECQVPGSSECIKKHVDEEKMKLQKELGPAFDDWKFNQMGEEASSNWTLEERKKFESIVKKSSPLKGKVFLKSALKALPNKNRETIISYYFNIIVPRNIGLNIKSGRLPTDINTDDEASASSSSSSRARKRSTAESKPAKRRFLTGLSTSGKSHQTTLYLAENQQEDAPNLSGEFSALCCSESAAI